MISIQFIKKELKTEIIEDHCFGLLEDNIKDKFLTNKEIVLAKGCSLAYIFTSRVDESTEQAYLNILNLLGLLDHVKIESEGTTRKAVISCELPGQEIVGKFEMLRHLDNSTNYVKCVTGAFPQFQYLYSDGRREAHAALLLPVILHLGVFRQADIFSTQRLWLYNSTRSILENIVSSRKITKSYRESKTFHGVWYYFLGTGHRELAAGTDIFFMPEEIMNHSNYFRNVAALSLQKAIKLFKEHGL